MEGYEEFVRRHDKYQFEVKLGYDLNRDRRREHYRVETFFFLPQNLDVNESTYTKRQFYRDLLLYIRFKTPDFSLASLNDPENPRSSLNKIKEKARIFLQERTQVNAANLEYEIKLLGCVLKSTLRDHVKVIERAMRSLYGEVIPPIDPLLLIREYLMETRKILTAFRALDETLKSLAVSVPPSLYPTFVYTDEYISLLVEGRTHLLLQFLYKMSSFPGIVDASAELAGLIQEETDYRRAHGYPSLVKENKDNERFIFRYSVLKKFVSSVLYLSVRTVEEGQGIQHLALAVAAGVAMVFATAVAFYYQKVYGTLSLSFFGVLVVSYMFKDRVKAVLQSYLQKRLSHNLFDQSTNIHDPFNGEKIGVCREVMHFTHEGGLDPQVLRLRDRDHITEVENNWRSERIIHYVKDITLFSQELFKNQSRKTGLTDIVRFNVWNFLSRMDEPHMDLFLLRNGRSETVKGSRVYHVNMVIKFTSVTHIRYERIRLVLTRQGIKRIEPVNREVILRTPGGSQ